MTLTQEALKRVVIYDHSTGIFTRAYTWCHIKAGDVTGTVIASGHIKIAIKQRRYYAHRLAWLYVYGSWPKGCIDHINCIPSDNRIANLRDVDRIVNAQNQRAAHAGNSSGHLGVSRRRSGRFLAQIQLDGKNSSLGTYDSPEEASAAYLEAKRRLHAGAAL